MTRRDVLDTSVAAALLAALAAPTGAEAAQATLKRDQLIRKAVPDMEGKEATVLHLTFPPGYGSQPDTHPGSVFGYVLEGEMVFQIQGQPATVYRAGDLFYEPPRAVHMQSRNPSKTKP